MTQTSSIKDLPRRDPLLALKAGRLRLGTRGSPLALAQAREIVERLRTAWPALAAPEAIETVIVKTTGDRLRDRPLTDIGGKALFAKEIEAALLAEEIDVAVHSLKDLPTQLPKVFALAAVPPREDPRDSLITAQPTDAEGLDALPEGAVVGTCSPRRTAQLLMLRPDLSIVTLRGNVETRLATLKSGAIAATLLGQAGLNRMGLAIGRPLPPPVFLPAATQGAIGLEIRSGDAASAEILAPLNHRESWLRSLAERACLAALNGSCHTPVAALAKVVEGQIWLDALFLLPNGNAPLRHSCKGPAEQAEALGRALGGALRGDAGPEHLALLED